MTEDRVTGSLVGLAVGDALGTTIEFQSRDSYTPVTDIVGGGPFNLRPGDWTDDTSMALCLAESLISTAPDLDADDLLSVFYRWYQQGHNSVKGHCFDIGGTTSSGIMRWRRQGSVVNNTDAHSAGNGGIMRLAPAAMISWSDADRASEIARGQSATTHASPECLDSADFLARYLVNLYQGADIRPVSDRWCESVQRIAETDYTGVSRDSISSSGYVIDTLEAAVWATTNANDFESAVLLAVNLGHDADTVGAVTGQIAGAIWGQSGIPAHWVKQITWIDRIQQLALELYRHG